jgi:hypothetical protein
MHIVKRPRDGAVAEQLDPIGDAYRHDFGERRAAEQRLSRLAGAGKDAEGSGTVSEIVERPAGLIGGITGASVIDEIARQILAQSHGQRVVRGIVASIEMRDADLGGNVRSTDRRDGPVELRMGGITKPVRILDIAWKIFAWRVRFVARPGQHHPPVRIATRDPLLNQIGLCKRRGRGTRDAETLLQYGVTDIPGVLFGKSRRRSENLPDFGRRRAESRLLSDALEQRRDIEIGTGGAEGQSCRAQTWCCLHQNTLDIHKIAPVRAGMQPTLPQPIAQDNHGGNTIFDA